MKKTILERQTRVMVFGTFDGLHKGHLNFFKQAKNSMKNSFLIVSIGRDKNVLKIKGKKPILSEKKRLALVKRSKFADRVVLAGQTDYLAHILKETPDIIALGYDQKAYIDKRGSRGRVLSHTASESKSHQGNPYVKELKKDLKNLPAQAGKGMKIKIIRLKPYKEHIYKNHLLKRK